MQRVGEIRARREKQFYKNRMKGNRAKQLEADRKLVEENQHLLPPQYRDQVEKVLEEEQPEKEEMEVEEDEEELDPEELEQEEKVEAKKQKAVKGGKKKQKLVRGQGAEDEDGMDVDG
ncbi:hypothetical protein KC355_g16774 [Hortaea werneckii]|nr:hypothetical protein KC355_g16774 [Hortaea werneckii]